LDHIICLHLNPDDENRIASIVSYLKNNNITSIVSLFIFA